MLQNSLTFSLLKKLWAELCSSKVYGFAVAVFTFFFDGYNNSLLKSFLLKLGDLSNIPKTPYFVKLFQL